MNMQSRVSFLTNNAEVRTIRRDLSPVLDPAGSHDWEVSDDFIEDGPRRKKYEDEDDRPRRRRKYDDDEDDDDYDDRPRRRR